MIAVATLLAAAALGAQDQLKETGLAFDCELRPQNPAELTKISPDVSAAPTKLFIWYGRFIAAKRETGGKPVGLLVDPTFVLAAQGQSYNSTSKWPESFVVRSETPKGIRLLVVDGTRPVLGKPGRYQARHSLIGRSTTTGNTTMSNLLVGDCAVASDVPYTVYWAKRTVK